MNKTLSILAGMMAAILLTSAIAPYSAYADDDNKKEKHKEVKKKIEEIRKKIASISEQEKSDETHAAVKLTIKAKGLAVTRSNSGLEADDATLDLSGKTYIKEGSYVRAALNGTLTVGNEQYKVGAEGRTKLEGRLEMLHLTGDVSKGGEEKRFSLKAMLVKSGDDKWEMVVDPAARLGSHVRIYALMGELKTIAITSGAASPALDRFKISAIGNQTAGSQFTFTVTAIDANGNVKADYNGTVTLSTDAGSSPYGNASAIASPYTFTAAADNGKHTFIAKMYNAKSNVTITASGSGKTITSNKFNVVQAAIAKVTLTPATAIVASNGTASFNAEALDAYGNKVSTGFIWAVSPSIGTLTVGSTTATLKAQVVSAVTLGILSVTASGTSVTGTASVTVNPP